MSSRLPVIESLDRTSCLKTPSNATTNTIIQGTQAGHQTQLHCIWLVLCAAVSGSRRLASRRVGMEKTKSAGVPLLGHCSVMISSCRYLQLRRMRSNRRNEMARGGPSLFFLLLERVLAGGRDKPQASGPWSSSTSYWLSVNGLFVISISPTEYSVQAYLDLHRLLWGLGSELICKMVCNRYSVSSWYVLHLLDDGTGPRELRHSARMGRLRGRFVQITDVMFLLIIGQPVVGKIMSFCQN
ncbi:hypothetical protein HD806DRAFT_386495 [Xylariaceae sp. AK1471]|nr:hypothetical protein HD806DRAFT_386495 [Xylariaceae sp. AK1471]